MNRKTLEELSVAEISSFLHAENTPYRPCELAERLGALSIDGNAEAQAVLVPFLGSHCHRSRTIAAKFLYQARDRGTASAETLEALTTFGQDPENSDIVSEVGSGQAATAPIPVDTCGR